MTQIDRTSRCPASLLVHLCPAILAFLLTLSLLSLALLSGCRGDVDSTRGAEPSATFDTISGVVVVTNPSLGAWREGEEWTLVEQTRIGKLEDESEDYLFRTALLGPIYGPHSTIVVQDFIGDVVSVYDRTGTFIRRFGGTGQGPGELTRPTSIGWDSHNGIWVGEPFSARYSLFDSLGVFVRTVRRPWIGTLRRVSPLLFLDDGTFTEELIGDDFQFVNFDPSTGRADTLASLKGPEYPAALSSRIGMMSGDRKLIRALTYSYIDRLRWDATTDGTVWSSLKGTLRLVQHDLITGDTLRIINTAHRQPALTPADEETIELGLHELRVDRSEVPVIRPIVDGIHVLDDGHVLVLVVESTATGHHAFDVFSPEGSFLGSIPLGFAIARWSRISSKGDDVLMVTTDELGVPQVVVSRLAR